MKCFLGKSSTKAEAMLNMTIDFFEMICITVLPDALNVLDKLLSMIIHERVVKF